MPQPPQIPTQIKNLDLVEKRRQQIVQAAVKLFLAQGFHKTTTRQLAAAAGFSIGSLYEYVNSKEDVLYLVCNDIHAKIEKRVTHILDQSAGGSESLAALIREYFQICHRMSDVILLIYQETRSLPPPWRKKVLEKELRITGLILNVLVRMAADGRLPGADERAIELAAHNISVLGHMWIFRRWHLSRHYRIEDYIRLQTDWISAMLAC